MQFFIGVIVLATGIGMVMKTEWLVQNFGSNAWAESTIGTSGGSRLMYKLIGLVMIFFGFALVTGLFGNILMATVGKLFIR